MLEVEAAIGVLPRAVVAWIAPAVQQIATAAPAAARLAGRLPRGGGVIDHPDLVHPRSAHHDQVVLGVVVHGVYVQPVGGLVPIPVSISKTAVLATPILAIF